MSGILTKVLHLPEQFPLIRGMLSYAIIWPTCSITQEYLEEGKTIENANWARAARFGFFGAFFMAPVFYGWMKYTSRFFKRKNLMSALTRAAIEQISYSPLAMAYFFFGMSLLEMKPIKSCVNEVREKFWPTYKIGLIFWPTTQTLNFYFISEKNRIVFVSAASFLWTVYLAHMKSKGQENDSKIQKNEPIAHIVDPNFLIIGPKGQIFESKTQITDPEAQIIDREAQIIDREAQITDPEDIIEPNVEIIDPKTQILDPNDEISDPKAQIMDPTFENFESNYEEIDPKTQIIDPNVKSIDPEAQIIDPEVLIIDPDVPIIDSYVHMIEPEDPNVQIIDQKIQNNDPTAVDTADS